MLPRLFVAPAEEGRAEGGGREIAIGEVHDVVGDAVIGDGVDVPRVFGGVFGGRRVGWVG